MAAFVRGLPWGRMVSVRSYLRCRFGKWETVKSHFRGWPRVNEGPSLTFVR
jgi:hypothetical protein